MYHHAASIVRATAASLGLALIASPATAQWTTISLHPTQTGASGSWLRDSRGTQQVGWIQTEAFASRASLWAGTADSHVNLHPMGIKFTSSFALATDGVQQGGYVGSGFMMNPAVWSGTAESFVNLLPDVGPGPAQGGIVLAVDGGMQGGSVVAFPGDIGTASLWSGTPESWINMSPAGSTYSQIRGMRGNQQVGIAGFGGGNDMAALWNGTPDSFVSLHPAHIPGIINSFLSATDGVQQVGNIRVGNALSLRAAVWEGTPESVVDLHPGIGVQSFANAVSDGYQVGYINLTVESSEDDIAVLWNGTADSWVNLHAFLSAEYRYSRAESIVVEGNTIFVSGYAFNSIEQRNEAMMWISVIPAPSTLPLLALGGLAAARRRRV